MRSTIGRTSGVVAEYEIDAHGSSYRIEADPQSLVAKRLIAGTPYEPWLLEHIYEQGCRGVAVDVGAHIGNHSLWLAAVVGVPVVAFEPLFYRELRANVALNGLEAEAPGAPGVWVETCALGEAEGTASDGGDRVLTDPGPAEKRQHECNRGEGRLYPGPGSISVRTLDSFGLTDVGLVKIDVEGMEPLVLRGAARTIQHEGSDIYAEARDEKAEEAQREVVAQWGYKRIRRFDRGTPIVMWQC